MVVDVGNAYMVVGVGCWWLVLNGGRCRKWLVVVGRSDSTMVVEVVNS